MLDHYLCVFSARYRNIERAIPHNRAAAQSVRFLAFHIFSTASKLSGKTAGIRPKCTPRSFAAAIPSACRWRMVSRSFWATNENTYRTISAISVPMRPLSRRMSRRGMSKTRMSPPLLSRQDAPLLTKLFILLPCLSLLVMQSWSRGAVFS